MRERTAGVRLNTVALLPALLLLLPSVVPPARAAAESASEEVLRQLGLNAATVQTLDLPTRERGGPLRVRLELDDRAAEIELLPWSLRAADFQLLGRGPGGATVEIQAPPPATYRGTVSGIPDSRVAASITEDGLSAWIQTPRQRWLVQPAPGGPATGHVVYRQQDAGPAAGVCAAVPPPPPDPRWSGSGPESEPVALPTPEPTTTQLALAAAGVQTLELAVDTDWELYLYHGSSAAAVLADVETLMNAVNLLYESQIQVAYTLTAVVMRTTEEEDLGWSWPEFKLDKLREDWLLNHASIRRDLVHHFCEKDIEGSTVGIAYLNVVCNAPSGGFGLSQTHFNPDFANRVALTAHEIGHNWGAEHCDGQSDCRIMCSAIGACEPEVDTFGSTAFDVITAHRDTSFCLTSAYAGAVYVDDDAPYPGLGTFSAPFATVGLGVQNSPDGGFLLLRDGSYPEVLLVQRPLVVKAGRGSAVVGR